MPAFHIIWFKSVTNFLRYSLHIAQSNRQTHSGNHNTSQTSLAEVILGASRGFSETAEQFVCTTQVPLLYVVCYNSAMTVNNMRGFSVIFASQAAALKTERRKTEDLLTEMLPRSVAKQLRAGKTVQAEEYEVHVSDFSHSQHRSIHGRSFIFGFRG